MLPILRLLVVTTAALPVCAPSATADDYHVAKQGDDANGNGTAAKPWRTITHALTSILPPPAPERHILHVGIGTWYPNAPERFPLNVRQGIHVRGVDRDLTIIAGRQENSRLPLPAPTTVLFEVRLPNGGWHSNMAWPAISNLTMQSARYGVQVLGKSTAASFLEIRDCTFTRNTYGIVAMNAAPIVEQCRFDANSTGAQTGNVVLDSPPTIIRRCAFTTNGIGVGVTNTRKAVVSSNRFENNGVGVMVGAVGIMTMTPRFENNVYHRNGFGWSGSAVLGGNLKTTARHETFFANKIGVSSYDGGRFGGNAEPDIANSIVWGSTIADLSGVTRGEVRHTTFRTAIGVAIAPTFGTDGLISVAPNFVDQGNGNLRLRTASPLVNGGKHLLDLPAVDADGEPRKTDHPDLGADEVNTFFSHAKAGSRSGELRLFLDAPRDAGRTFVIAASQRKRPNAGIRIDKRTIPLKLDALFVASLTNPRLSGTLNGAGQALVRLQIDRHARRSGNVIHFVFITLDRHAMSSIPIRMVSNVVSVDLGKL